MVKPHQANKLRSSLLGTLKDKASLLTKATLLLSSSTDISSSSSVHNAPPPDLVVLRATTHCPSPCHPKHITALLSFGRGSRLAASALVNALSTRLRSTRDPHVALKCLLAVHYIVRHGAFILHDQLLSALRPSPLGGRNPLNLSAFRPSAYARWYARVLELLLVSHRALGSTFPCTSPDEERTVSLANGELLVQLDALVAIMEEVGREPGREEGGGLAGEVGRMVGEESGAIVGEVLMRVREVGERVEEMGFGELVEVGYMMRRVEGCEQLDGDRRLRAAVRAVKGLVGEVVNKPGRALRSGEKVGESERVEVLRSSVGVRLESTRWGPY